MSESILNESFNGHFHINIIATSEGENKTEIPQLTLSKKLKKIYLHHWSKIFSYFSDANVDVWAAGYKFQMANYA